MIKWKGYNTPFTPLLPNTKFAEHSTKDLLHINETRNFAHRLCGVPQLLGGKHDIIWF